MKSGWLKAAMRCGSISGGSKTTMTTARSKRTRRMRTTMKKTTKTNERRLRIRPWLRAFNYEDVEEKIAKAEARHKASGSKERRNWADVLCGTKEGTPVVIAGIEFPILASAQRSRNRPVTPKAIQRNEHEEFPG